MLKKVRLDVNPAAKVKDLGVGKQQLVEIAKALSKDVKLLILDEPTAALNEDDSENLLNLLRDLKDAGRDLHHDLAQAERSHRDRRHGHRAARRPDDLHPGCPQGRSLRKCADQAHGGPRDRQHLSPSANTSSPRRVVLEVKNWNAYDPDSGQEHPQGYQLQRQEGRNRRLCRADGLGAHGAGPEPLRQPGWLSSSTARCTSRARRSISTIREDAIRPGWPMSPRTAKATA